MTIFQELINLDLEIEQTSHTDLVFVNDFANSTEAERKEIFMRLTTQYNQGDKISLLPQCQCGKFKSKAYLNLVCPSCHTVVQSTIEQNIQSNVWFRTPDGIGGPDGKGLISPIFYTMLSMRFTKNGWNIIQWLTDPNYAPLLKDTPFMQRLRERGFERGWNAFVMNFDAIMEYLLAQKDLNTSVKKGEIDYLYYLWKKDRHKLFSRYIPVPNKALFVFENTNTGIYRNDSTGKAMEFISLMLSIERSLQPLSQRARENRIAKMYQKIAEYQIEHVENELRPKTAQIRRNTIATKNIMAYRSVITSITGPWDYNAIMVPWGVGLTMFRLHLVNKLMRQGFSLNKALGFLINHTGKYNPLLDILLQELIDEAPDGKIWCTIQRNPSLKQGSMQLVYIAGFYKDPGNKTTGMPLPITKAPNAKNYMA